MAKNRNIKLQPRSFYLDMFVWLVKGESEMFSFADSLFRAVQEDWIIRLALGSQVMYSPLYAAFLNCKQVSPLSDILPGDQEKQNPSVLKKMTVKYFSRDY